MSARTSKAERREELLRELAFGNPPPEEKWCEEADFDPRLLRGTLTDAERKGLIEIERAALENWHFRFTPKGREVEAAVASRGGKP